MGLKGPIISSIAASLTPDKIRPKWDWKCTIILDTLSTIFMIKSDQNGIESI